MDLSKEFVLILTKINNQKASLLGEEIKNWLLKRSIEAEIISTAEFSGIESLKKRPNFLIVLGGDGTVLSTIHKLIPKNLLPILGFNLGRVGFLTTSDPEKWQETLEKILLKKFEITSYMMLNYKVIRDNKEISQGLVVNDIVIGRYKIARLVELQLWYDDIEIGKLRADGLIVTTPLGSTAYAWAAGGALIDPCIKAFEICPVCQFLTNIRPLILPSNKTLRVKIVSPLKGFILTLDGQKEVHLKPYDVVEIREAKEVVHFIQTKPTSYIERLKAKGYI